MNTSKEYLDLLRDAKLFLSNMKETHLFFYQLNPLDFTKTPITIEKKAEVKIAPKIEEKKERELTLQKKETPKKPLPKKIEIALTKPAPKEELTDDLKSDFQKLFPQLKVLDVKDDHKAKKIASGYLTKNKAETITLLVAGHDKQQMHFLTDLKTAIQNYFFPCRLISIDTIEKEKTWDDFLKSPNLKLLIACDSNIWPNKDLMKYYREFPQKSENYLSNIPLFLLPDLSIYFKDPHLKRSLWKALCQKIQKL